MEDSFQPESPAVSAAKRLRQAILRYGVRYPHPAVYRVPFAALPEDAICQIFRLCACAESGDFSADLARVTSSDIRLVLCRVCSLWRSIALGMHELWSDVQISFKPLDAPRLSKILDTWLYRGGEYPIKLVVHGNDQRIAQVVVRYLYRCRVLHVTPLHSMRSFPDLPSGSLNRLETLSLREDFGHHLSSPSGLQLFTKAACLRSLTLDGLRQGTVLNIPWHQLTQLSFTHSEISTATYYGILSHCVALANGRICLHRGQFDDAGDLEGRSIVLSELVSLTLEAPVLDDGARFLKILAMPALADLTLDLSEDSSPLISVPRFPALRRFSITSSNWEYQSNGDLLPWLHACNSAVEVFLPHHLLEPASSEIGEGSLLPNLELFVVREAKLDAVITILEARLASPQHSNIAEFGFTGSFGRVWNLSVEQREAPPRGKIEEYARQAYKDDDSIFAPILDNSAEMM
ncbi:hypothetical protein B0H11DRAFT_2264911 [Mycena galericulata]|nr:hypothetical protein B0H11DRAFT_2264911 [Mycena galericulata]